MLRCAAVLLWVCSLHAQVSILISSSPAGQAFAISGAGCAPGGYVAPQTLSWTAGSSCSVSFVSPQSSQIGTQYVFTAWSDGPSANPRTIIAPSQPTTYTAGFKTQYLITAIGSPTAGGTVSGGGYYDAGTTATLTAAPASGFRVVSWTPAIASPGATSASVVVASPSTVSVSFAPSTVPPPQHYTVTTISAGSGTARAPHPINNYGQVAGTVTVANGTAAELWTPVIANSAAGTITNLGAFTPQSLGTMAVAVNDFGQVAGAAGTPSTPLQAMLWTPATPNGTPTTTAAIFGPPNGSSADIADMNNFGQVAGRSPSVIWTPAAANGTTGTLNSSLRNLTAINDSGQAIANDCSLAETWISTPSLFTPSSPHASQGTTTPLNTILGPTAITIQAIAINNSGAVVGTFGSTCAGIMPGAPPQTFLWTPSSPNGTNGTAVKIPLPPGFTSMVPTAMNNGGQIVGTVSGPNGGFPFLYSGGTIYDLSTISTQSIGNPVGINDRGQIVTSGNGIYLLTPDMQASPAAASPQSGSGTSQTMAFTFSDPLGWQDLGILNVLINNFIDGRVACYVAYSVLDKILYLVNDAGFAGGPYAGSLALGNTGTIQNSQCTVGLTSATGSGNTFTLTLAITFKSAFAGNRILYAAARDTAQNTSGWQPLGVWQVTGGTQATTTAVVGMSPTSGTGVGPTPFTFIFSDTKGVQDLGVMNILVNTSLDGRRACYLAFVHRQGDLLFVLNDTGTAILAGKDLSVSGSINNGQCTVSWGNNAITPSGNNLVLSLNIGFSSGFGPRLVFYLAARDVNEANNTGWQASGTWMVQ